MIEELSVLNYSTNTLEVYIAASRVSLNISDSHPDRLGPEHIRQYQVFLVQQKKVSWRYSINS